MLARCWQAPIKAILPLRGKGSRLSWFFSSTECLWQSGGRWNGVPGVKHFFRHASRRGIYTDWQTVPACIWLLGCVGRLFVNVGPVTFAFQGFFQCADKSVGYHVHVVPAVKARADTSCTADSVVYHFGDGCIVCPPRSRRSPIGCAVRRSAASGWQWRVPVNFIGRRSFALPTPASTAALWEGSIRWNIRLRLISTVLCRGGFSGAIQCEVLYATIISLLALISLPR